MPKPIADDLRRRLLEAWGAGEGSLRELAVRFRVSYWYARKIREQQLRTGQAERVPQSRHGFVSRVNETAREQLRTWVREQPDRTLAELQELLRRRQGIPISRPRVSQLLRELGLRRKKNAARA
ncbi:MAG TPA: winged helix-turn-helix domain-containing protein [Terriglobales bacterium]|nr:winged helix-turn-helix domain-containing protein [Terriglobales bacterium]